ncbi:hypothetical protein D3C81_10360 [compost metagenome]
MVKGLKVSILILLASSLIGCSTIGATRSKVATENARTGEIMGSYTTNKTKAEGLEEAIKKAIIIGKYTEEGSSIIYDNDKFETFQGDIAQINKTLLAYIETFNSIEDSKVLREGDKRYPIEDENDFIRGIIEVHYFLDDDKNTLEQLFIIKVPQGLLITLTLHWLGGTCYDIQTSYYN